MSDTSTHNTQNRSGNTNPTLAAPLAFLTAPFRFAGSITLGIILLTLLLVSMAFGTFVESEYGSAVAKFVFYDNIWFHGLIALLALNLIVSVILRFPWGRYYIPFLIAHAGILILLLGCCLTWQRGEEAQITLPEGTIGTVAVKPERQQLNFKYTGHAANVPEPIRFPLQLGPFSWQDYQYDNWVKDGKPYKAPLWYAMRSGKRTIGEYKLAGKTSSDDILIDILDYHAHSKLEPVPPLEVSVLWNKTVLAVTELGETKEIPRNWEQITLDWQQRHSVPGLPDARGISAKMSQGERISYGLALCQEELTAFQTSRPKGGSNAGFWGEVVLYYSGKNYSVNVDQLLTLPVNRRFSVEGSDLEIGEVRFSERGPLIHFSVFTPSGEKGTLALFPDNPELNVHARKLGVFGSYWVDPQRMMQQSAAHAENPMLQWLAIERLDFMQGPDNRLYYRLWSGQKIIADGTVPVREGSKKPQFRIAVQSRDEAEIVIDRFSPQDVPGCRIVSATINPGNSGRQNEQRLKLRVVFDGKEDTFWIRAAAPTVVPLAPEQDQIRYIYGNGRTLEVQLNFETIELGFGILLKQSERRTEPGTRMSSHYSSLVDYVEPIDAADAKADFSQDLKKYRTLPKGESVLISMNRPSYYHGTKRGYWIYQASYVGPYYPDQPQFHAFYDGEIFPWEERPRESIAMSTLSVNADPGRGWKYLGCLLTVLGTALFVWKKRW